MERPCTMRAGATEREVPMEQADWMNDRVRGEIESLQRTHGFEGDEVLAFWLLQQTAKQMNALRRVDILKEMGRHEGAPISWHCSMR
jgi:hypothetical protein